MSARFFVAATAALLLFSTQANAQATGSLDKQLRSTLARNGFTGTIQSQLLDANHLNRPSGTLNTALIGLGSFLWFDPVLSIHDDTTCASCHSPTNAWGDTQPIAIGVESNYRVGEGSERIGPRNLRRSPSTANAAFYPAMMWDGRFSALSGDPFDNSVDAFDFPEPEGDTAFPAGDPNVRHLLAAQAFLPVTELVEMAGFTGTYGIDDELDPMFDEFDDGLGDDVPAADADGYRHDPIRDAILDRLNGYTEYRGAYITKYRTRFANLFDPVLEAQGLTKIADGGDIEFWMVGAALAEFQFNQVAADAPLDKYVRLRDNAQLTRQEKQGALVFFGKGQCVSCHQVSDESNEMFSDFQEHVLAVPQVAPEFGYGFGDVLFDGTGADEDYGLERTTGDPDDRYKFRTAPLRNLAMSPAYMHNGAFTDLEDAIVHHLDVDLSQTNYDVTTSGLAAIASDLTKGPTIDMSYVVDTALTSPPSLTPQEIANLVIFVRDALYDSKMTAAKQCDAMPDLPLPSGAELEEFPGCP